MRKNLLFIIVFTMAVSALTLSAFAQDDTKNTATPVATPAAAPVAAAPAAPAMKEEAPKVSELSIYGEVQSVNAQANSMMVQYYDYDNDEERSTEIALDSASKLDNAKAIADIKKGDWVDVTYTTSSGKNVAKIVSVEKEEPAQDENAPAADE